MKMVSSRKRSIGLTRWKKHPKFHSFFFKILFHPFCSLLLPFHQFLLSSKKELFVHDFLSFIHSFMLEILFHPFLFITFYFSFIHCCSRQRNKTKKNKKEREVSLDHSAKPRLGAAMAMVSPVALTMACVCPAATVVAQSAAASCSGLFAGETSLGKVLLLPHHPFPFSSIGVSCSTLFMAAPLLDCSNSRLGRRETHLQGRFSRRFAKFQQFNQGADTSAVNLSQEGHDEQEEEEEEEEAEEDEEVEDERCTLSFESFHLHFIYACFSCFCLAATEMALLRDFIGTYLHFLQMLLACFLCCHTV